MIRVLGPTCDRSHDNRLRSSATQPAVEPNPGRATWMKTALPRPATRGRAGYPQLHDCTDGRPGPRSTRRCARSASPAAAYVDEAAGRHATTGAPGETSLAASLRRLLACWPRSRSGRVPRESVATQSPASRVSARLAGSPPESPRSGLECCVVVNPSCSYRVHHQLALLPLHGLLPAEPPEATCPIHERS